jgi:hypothetical protein
LKPSPPRGPQCRVSFWNGAAAFGVGLNPRSSTHATNPSTHMPRKRGHSPLLRRAGKKWRCWSRYAASREDPLRAVIPPPRGPASFPCSVNQPEAVRRSSSTLKPSPPRGPQCRVSFWNGAAAFGVCFFNKYCESSFVKYSDISKDLTIDFDRRFLKTVD